MRFPFGEMRKFWKYDSGAGSPTRRLSRMPLNRNFKTVNVMLCVFYPIFFFNCQTGTVPVAPGLFLARAHARPRSGAGGLILIGGRIEGRLSASQRGLKYCLSGQGSAPSKPCLPAMAVSPRQKARRWGSDCPTSPRHWALPQGVARVFCRSQLYCQVSGGCLGT